MHSSPIREYLEKNRAETIKLHLGCGGNKLSDYINVDLYPSDPDITDSSREFCMADVYDDIRNLDLEPESVDEIFLSHVIEHFVKWEAQDAIRTWYTVLKKNAPLIIETPDFIRCFIMLFHFKKKNRIKARRQFYGNQWDRLDYETHRYVWSARELKEELLKSGFSKVSVTHRTKTHKPFRDMRVVAIK